MTKDLTTSQLDRQNILNNEIAVTEIQSKSGVEGILCSIENVLKAEYSASNYRNPFLATAMVNLNMIDTVGSGILKMFLAQKKRCFPLPDYDFSNHEVRMKLYGKVLDIDYSKRLLNEDLPLSEVIELDRKQKSEINNKPAKATNATNAPKSGLKSIKWPKKWPEKCQIIYDAIKENKNITIPELEKLCDTGHTTIKKMLNEMQKEGFIKHEGTPNGGHWEIIEEDNHESD